MTLMKVKNEETDSEFKYEMVKTPIGYCPFCEEEQEFCETYEKRTYNGEIAEYFLHYACGNCGLFFTATYDEDLDDPEEDFKILQEKLKIKMIDIEVMTFNRKDEGK